MKKITFFIKTLEMGGAEKVLTDLVMALDDEKKYDIEVVTTEENNTYLSNLIKNRVKYSYLISEEKLRKLKKIPFINKGLISLYKKLSFKKLSKNRDILVDYLDGDFSKYIKNCKNKRKICWLHLSYDIVKKRKKNIDKKLAIYDKVVVICEEIKEEIKSANNDLYKKINVIYNLFDFEKKIKDSNEEFLPDEKEYLKDKYFLTVCRLDETQKDIKTLLKGYKNYIGENKLYIIGNGASEKELKDLSKNLKLEDKVKFLGERKNPYKWMKNSEAFILSSKTEGLPTVLIEALVLGCKVISSECKTGPREILLNGEIGELFLVGDEIELLHKLEIIEEKEYDVEKIKKSLYRFDKDNVLTKVEGLFE